ncbi:hypothetical protein G5V57_21640 [Nordella sp. HKS 07]|uniref:hypothetical protein n=1 Tax=Nordella sp. HKS 07 TaxID=2712222 RepID=UPI0013E1BDDB|nr:hypothetical protein [Nordella sp. HKS 07]QIG50094.1 hypothetical protein G5V57_21640 [Nordella sp. HKS 07]
MTLKNIAISIGLAIIAAFCLEITGGPVNLGVVSSAEARVGRPLTPVSVAGVGRRTARRCAAGVYNC